MTESKPSLALVEDSVDVEDVEQIEPPTPPPAAPPAPVTVAQQITNYAALTKRLKVDYKLSEGTIVKLTELALNERFTLIQMGLAQPRAASPAPQEDPADGNSDEG